MRLALLVAGRSLLGRPGRTAFSILGVAMGIATVVGVFTVDHVTVLDRTRRLEPGGGADLEVRPADSVRDPRSELAALEGVAGVAAFFQNDVRFRPLAGESAGEPRDDRFHPVRLIGLEAAGAAALGAHRVAAGDDLPLDGSGVLIGRALAERFSLTPGDRVVLAPPLRAARRACVEGRLQELEETATRPREEVLYVAGVLAREGLGRRSRGEVVVLDYHAARALLEDVHVEPTYWLRRDPGVDLEALEARLSAGFAFERDARRAVGQMADERAFRNGVRLAGLFALLLGLFVIFHTLSMSLLERVREIGSLHSLGTTLPQLAGVFFAEALVIAGCAGVLGVGGGVLLARLLLLAGITTLGVQEHPLLLFDVPWRTALSLAGLGVGIALAGSVYPILRVRGTDVVAALRGEDVGRRRPLARGFHVLALVVLVAVAPALFFSVVPVVGAAEPTLVRTVLLGLFVLGLLIGVPLLRPALASGAAVLLVRPLARRFPLAAALAAGSMRQGPARVAASATAIAVVTAAYVALAGMTASLRAEIEEWGERAVARKLFVEELGDADFAALAGALGALPDVLGVEPAEARAYAHFLLIGLPVDQLARYGPLAADPELAAALGDGQGIVLSERLARQRELGVGDAVAVRTSGHGVQEFRVVAVSDAYGYFIHPDERAYGVTALGHLERFFCADTARVGALAVRLAPDGDAAAVTTLVQGLHPRARVTPGTAVLRHHLADIDRDFVLFDVILVLTVVLAGLGVLNGQLLAALERRKELGILRALGTTNGQLAGAVLLESAAVGLLGGLLGLAVGAALTPVLVSSLRALSGLALPLRSGGPELVAAVLGAAGLAVVAGLYPLWRTNRTDVVRAVRTG